MDPNANLQEQCELSKKLLTSIDSGEPLSEDDVDRLASLVQALDEWLASGGFLPSRWER